MSSATPEAMGQLVRQKPLDLISICIICQKGVVVANANVNGLLESIIGPSRYTCAIAYTRCTTCRVDNACEVEVQEHLETTKTMRSIVEGEIWSMSLGHSLCKRLGGHHVAKGLGYTYSIFTNPGLMHVSRVLGTATSISTIQSIRMSEITLLGANPVPELVPHLAGSFF